MSQHTIKFGTSGVCNYYDIDFSYESEIFSYQKEIKNLQRQTKNLKEWKKSVKGFYIVRSSDQSISIVQKKGDSEFYSLGLRCPISAKSIKEYEILRKIKDPNK